MKISAEDLTFTYKKSNAITLENFFHNFQKGSVTVVSGVSGRGKSTLLYLLGLMLTPDSGEVLLDDSPTSAMSDRERSSLRGEYISMVFQDAQLDSKRSTLENVAEGVLYSDGHAFSEIKATALLRRLEVAHRKDSRPGEISGGQAQRIALCRALIKDPKIILADEPTGNLDPTTASLVWETLQESAHQYGTTVIIASHDPNLISQADVAIEL